MTDQKSRQRLRRSHRMPPIRPCGRRRLQRRACAWQKAMRLSREGSSHKMRVQGQAKDPPEVGMLARKLPRNDSIARIRTCLAISSTCLSSPSRRIARALSIQQQRKFLERRIILKKKIHFWNQNRLCFSSPFGGKHIISGNLPGEEVWAWSVQGRESETKPCWHLEWWPFRGGDL